uniref:Amino acid transporter transmembrane domain-containing protein n=1 Tax=Quercus lobata TaxID=97700 RepID=A0A7N2QZG9_QUELO
MIGVVQTSLALCTTVYIMTGLFGFLLFGDSTLSDSLSKFDTDLGVPYSSLFNDVVPRPLASDNFRFAIISMGLVVIILLGAIFIPSRWVAFEFTGATVGVLLAFIFPASISLKDPHGIGTRKDKVTSICMIILAVFSNAIAIYSDAYALLTEEGLTKISLNCDW